MIKTFAQALFVSLFLQLPLAHAAEPSAEPLKAGFEDDFTYEPPGADLAGRIAFVATIDGVDRILVLDLDSKRFRVLVDLPGNNTYPQWSPDGTKLAFTSDRDGRRLTYISSWDGSQPRRVTKEREGVEDHPSWSPDGTEVLFSMEKDRNDEAESNVASASVASGAIRMLTSFKSRNMAPRWKPGGEAITYTTNRFWPGWDVCTLTLKDQTEKCQLNGSQSYFRAAWSHSGKLLAYSFGQTKYVDLSIFDAEKSSTSPLAAEPGNDYDPAWSEDDSRLLFAHENEGNGIYSIFIADLKSSPKRLIFSKHSLRYPAWTSARTIDLEARRILEAEGVTPRPRPSAVPTATASGTSSSTGTPDS